MNPILICLDCVECVSIESPDLYEWLQIHIYHTILGDTNSEWFDEWKQGVELGGSDSNSN